MQSLLGVRSLLCGAVAVVALSGLALSGCNNSGGSSGIKDADAKKFSTRVDPNNPPPEAAAAMAKMQAKGQGAPQNPNAPISTPAPK